MFSWLQILRCHSQEYNGVFCSLNYEYVWLTLIKIRVLTTPPFTKFIYTIPTTNYNWRIPFIQMQEGKGRQANDRITINSLLLQACIHQNSNISSRTYDPLVSHSWKNDRLPTPLSNRIIYRWLNYWLARPSNVGYHCIPQPFQATLLHGSILIFHTKKQWES